MNCAVLDNTVTLVPVNHDNLTIYLTIGIKSYRENYLHLWENEDPTPYISNGFTSDVVERELQDPNVLNFPIINLDLCYHSIIQKL